VKGNVALLILLDALAVSGMCFWCLFGVAVGEDG
jgi:hypothetical protein